MGNDGKGSRCSGVQALMSGTIGCEGISTTLMYHMKHQGGLCFSIDAEAMSFLRSDNPRQVS